MIKLHSLEFSNLYIFYISLIISFLILYISFFKYVKSISSILSVVQRNSINKDDVFLMINCLMQAYALLLLSIAAGNPIEKKSSEYNKREIRDIFFVVDVSRSMLADDFSPNRLEVAKKYIREFVELRSEDRIGINIFAEKIITLSPLTFDHQTLVSKIEDVSVGFLGNGTNIGDGIVLAVSRLEKSDAISKVIVLLTDGVSNAGSISPGHAGDIAKEKGIKIYGIGIGTSGDAFIPYSVGNRVMRQRIPGGNIDHGLLSEISDKTKGKYYKATNEAALKSIFLQIDQLEKTKVSLENPFLVKYNYRIYLLFGLFIFLISEVIRRKFIRFSF